MKIEFSERATRCCSGACKLILLSAFVTLLFACNQQTEQPSVSNIEALDPVKLEQKTVIVEPDGGKTWNIFSLQIVGKIMSEQTDGAYSVVLSTTPPNGGPPLHVHDREDEVFYVLEGTYEFTYGQQKKVVGKGALVHLPRKLPHGFRNVGDTPGLLLNTITPGGFEQFFEEIDQLPKNQPLDRQKVQEIASTYGLKFLPADGGK